MRGGERRRGADILTAMIHVAVHLDAVAKLRNAGQRGTPSLVATAHAARLGGADRVVLQLDPEGTGVGESDLELLRDAFEGELWIKVELPIQHRGSTRAEVEQELEDE